jgi:F-type H+-transporting ATPase subunit a
VIFSDSAGEITVGEHLTVTFGGLTFNVDTIVATVAAGAIVVILGLLVARSASSEVPGKLQMFYETVVDQVEEQVGGDLRERAPWLVPLAVTLFLFILASNWLGLIPGGWGPELFRPPTADVNLTYALGFTVFFWSLGAGIRIRGARSYLAHLKEPFVVMAPINVIEELIKPFTLSLRLFGNIFAGVVMLQIFTLLPTYLVWMPTTVWKLFDLFIGLIQAFIFALLTILYFSMAIGPREGHESHAH